MDRRSSHVSPEINITIQAEREPEDSPAGPSNSHESKDGGSSRSSLVGSARRRRREPLGAPYPASWRPRSRPSGSSGRSSPARSALSSSSEVLFASDESDPDNPNRSLFHQMALNRGEVASDSSEHGDQATDTRSPSDDDIDLQTDYGSGRETNSDHLKVPDPRPKRGKRSFGKTPHRRSGRDVNADEKLSDLERASLERASLERAALERAALERAALERASLELALGLTVYQFERTHEDLTVRDALAALGTEGDRLSPEAQKILQEAWNRSGFQELSEEEKTQNRNMANRPILTASFDGESFLASVTRQHLAAAEYLFAQKPLWRSAQAEKDLNGLRTAYGNWEKLGSDSPERDTLLMKPLTSGEGRNLRARMWSALGWSLITTFNSQVGALSTEEPVPSEKSGNRGELRKAAVDEAAAMLAISLTSSNDADQLKKVDPDTYHSLSHMIQSLSLLRTNWGNKQWHKEGSTIALVRLQDVFDQQVTEKYHTNTLATLKSMLASQKAIDHTKLVGAMSSVNLRVLHGNAHGQPAEWKRLASQLSIDATWFQKGIIPEPLREGIKKLVDIQSSKYSTDLLNALTKYESVTVVRDSVQSQLPKDWATGWHFEPVRTK